MTALLFQHCVASEPFHDFVMASLSRHRLGDWSDMDEEDQISNRQAVEQGGRVFSSYHIPMDIESEHDRIWIITEHDRSATTILYPDQY